MVTAQRRDLAQRGRTVRAAGWAQRGVARTRSLLLAAVLLVALAAPAAAEPEISAAGALLWEPASDAVLLDREADAPRPMASTTKIMTALLVLEEADLDDDVTISANAAQVGAVPGAATLALQTGQTVPMRTLLTAIMTESANDAAVAIAEHLAESEAAFAERMNARAEELGLSATRFVNASGLTNDPEHVASPADLAELARVAMQDPDFAELAGAAFLIDEVAGPLDNRNELLGTYEGATGVKTGFTELAGRTLVASATRGERTLYAVVLGAEDSFADAAALLDYGFDDFVLLSLPTDAEVAAYRWADTDVPVTLTTGLSETLPVDAGIAASLRLRPALSPPVAAGTPAGELVVLLDGEEFDRLEVQIARDVAPPTPGPPSEQIGAAIADGLRALARTEPIPVDPRAVQAPD